MSTRAIQNNIKSGYLREKNSIAWSNLRVVTRGFADLLWRLVDDGREDALQLLHLVDGVLVVALVVRLFRRGWFMMFTVRIVGFRTRLDCPVFAFGI